MNINPETALIALNGDLLKLRELDKKYWSERRNLKDAIDQRLLDVAPKFFAE